MDGWINDGRKEGRKGREGEREERRVDGWMDG